MPLIIPFSTIAVIAAFAQEDTLPASANWSRASESEETEMLLASIVMAASLVMVAVGWA